MNAEEKVYIDYVLADSAELVELNISDVRHFLVDCAKMGEGIATVPRYVEVKKTLPEARSAYLVFIHYPTDAVPAVRHLCDAVCGASEPGECMLEVWFAYPSENVTPDLINRGHSEVLARLAKRPLTSKS